MIYPIVFTAVARDDFREAYTSALLATSEAAAKEQFNALIDKIYLLEQFPSLGVTFHHYFGREENVRLLVASPYVIFYSFDGKQILILAVCDQAEYQKCLNSK
jgi:plasmid stabilization system protein ParE